MKFRFVKILACGLLAGVLAIGGSGVASVTAYAGERYGIVLSEEDEAEIQALLQELRDAGKSEEAIKEHEQAMRKVCAERRKMEAREAGNANSGTVVTNPATAVEDPIIADTQASDIVMFDAEFYAQTYPEVVAILGKDHNVLYNHYIMYGKAEGRRACAADLQQPALSDGTLFDAEYYAQTNPDVVAVFGTNKDALYTHYVMFGKAEGRKACAADVH